MSKYTFKCPYGEYSFSTEQIERNPYLNKEEKEIMNGLANWQTSVKEVKPKRKTLIRHKDVAINFKDKRWYEDTSTFIARKLRERKPVSKVKEVIRENLNIEKSIFEDGTEVTTWDSNIKFFI